MKKRLMKVAYKTPPQENWNNFRDPEQRNPNYITDEHYARLAEAGFTHGLALLEHGSDVALRALAMAEKHGLQYYVRDEINWANILHKDFYYLNGENYRKYMQSPAFAGVYVHDEPNASKYPELANMVKGYYEFFGEVGEPLVNLLPTYANHIEQLGADNYEAYIRGYIEQVPISYVMYDHYPFRLQKNGEWLLHTDYLYNAETAARLCKEYGKELRTFLQACEVDEQGGALMSEMLSFQIHTHLAYGSHALVYYYYWGGMCGLRNGVVTENGTPTHIYEAAKSAHEQIARYEEPLMDCVWQKTLYLKGKKHHHNQVEFARFACENGEEFSSEYDCIVGVFDYKGKTAYYAVNYVNPIEGLQNKLSFRLNGGFALYGKDGAKCVDGVGECVLGVGEGVFFLPKEKE